jgi:hypothetical protein
MRSVTNNSRHLQTAGSADARIVCFISFKAVGIRKIWSSPIRTHTLETSVGLPLGIILRGNVRDCYHCAFFWSVTVTTLRLVTRFIAAVIAGAVVPVEKGGGPFVRCVVHPLCDASMGLVPDPPFVIQTPKKYLEVVEKLIRQFRAGMVRLVDGKGAYADWLTYPRVRGIGRTLGKDNDLDGVAEYLKILDGELEYWLKVRVEAKPRQAVQQERKRQRPVRVWNFRTGFTS